MKQIQALLIIIVALSIAACTGNKNSDTIEIHPDRFIRNQSGSILPMYHFDGNFIVKDNELFSVDTVDITFPVLENSIDTAYTFIYFHDDTIRALKRTILILASNYSTDSMLLYCDLNTDFHISKRPLKIRR